MLFGRIVDALAGALAGVGPAARTVAPLVGPWVGFGLFMIVCRHDGRLVCRPAVAPAAEDGAGGLFRTRAAIADRLSFGAHSGRLMKVMLTGTDTLWRLWLTCFAIISVACVLIACCCRCRSILNWGLGLALIVLCVAFAVFTVW